jgi:hypothetical protein
VSDHGSFGEVAKLVGSQYTTSRDATNVHL